MILDPKKRKSIYGEIDLSNYLFLILILTARFSNKNYLRSTVREHIIPGLRCTAKNNYISTQTHGTCLKPITIWKKKISAPDDNKQKSKKERGKQDKQTHIE